MSWVLVIDTGIVLFWESPVADVNVTDSDTAGSSSPSLANRPSARPGTSGELRPSQAVPGLPSVSTHRKLVLLDDHTASPVTHWVAVT